MHGAEFFGAVVMRQRPGGSSEERRRNQRRNQIRFHGDLLLRCFLWGPDCRGNARPNSFAAHQYRSFLGCTLNACVNGLGLGVFLSYQTAPYRKSNKIRYVLEEFEIEPMPVQVVYPHTRRLSTTVRAFVDECVRKLRQVRLD